MYQLLDSPWIPVQRADGTIEQIPPYAVTGGHEDNPVVAVQAIRPDFTGSLVQFLIGLVQTTFAPDDEKEWRRFYEHPPSPEELKTRFHQYESAFLLGSENVSPLFLQEQSLDGSILPISRLFLEMPGENAEKNNTDLFLKRGGIGSLCPACAASALYTYQTHASFGGAGHRVGLRGGGPLSTIVRGNTLWHTIWLNVLKQSDMGRFGDIGRSEDKAIFPWLEAWDEERGKQVVSSSMMHPCHMFWGMPRRIRLEFGEKGTCDLCGATSDITVTGFVTKAKGMNYGFWHHTLTPVTTDLKKQESSCQHVQPGGIPYRYWTVVMQPTSGKDYLKEPAPVVTDFFAWKQKFVAKKSDDSSVRVWSSGYDMDKAKARCYYEGTMPVFAVGEEFRKDFEDAAQVLVETADYASKMTVRQVKAALFSNSGDAKGDLSVITSRFWQDTENAFYEALASVERILPEKGHDGLSEDGGPNQLWFDELKTEVFGLFDEYALSLQMGESNPGRIARARRDLSKKFYSKKGIRASLELIKT